MKPRLISLVVIFIMLGTAFPALVQQQETPPVTLMKISDNLFEIRGGSGANGGLYIGDYGVLIIDAKQDKNSVDQVINAVKGLTDKPITHLVNTHSDGDHIYGNRFFPESVTFVAHENCRKEFFHPASDGSPSEWNDPELAPFIPSSTFRDKMEIFLGSKKVELWYFGIGHTTGDAVVYFPEEKTAFIGDQFFTGRPQLIHSYKGGNSLKYVKTMSKMLETLDVEQVCSGHSDMVTPQVIRDHIGTMILLQLKVQNLIEDGKNLEEILAEFPENEQRLITSIFNEITDR
ncbi:MBL fold metallo-hydrolase [candidate division KSB1 bacterium]